MERLDREVHNRTLEQEESHYSTPSKQLQDVIKHVNDSAVNHARAAHYNDTLHQKQQEETRYYINISCVGLILIFTYWIISRSFNILVLQCQLLVCECTTNSGVRTQLNIPNYVNIQITK